MDEEDWDDLLSLIDKLPDIPIQLNENVPTSSSSIPTTSDASPRKHCNEDTSCTETDLTEEAKRGKPQRRKRQQDELIRLRTKQRKLERRLATLHRNSPSSLAIAWEDLVKNQKHGLEISRSENKRLRRLLYEHIPTVYRYSRAMRRLSSLKDCTHGPADVLYSEAGSSITSQSHVQKHVSYIEEGDATAFSRQYYEAQEAYKTTIDITSGVYPYQEDLQDGVREIELANRSFIRFCIEKNGKRLFQFPPAIVQRAMWSIFENSGYADSSYYYEPYYLRDDSQAVKFAFRFPGVGIHATGKRTIRSFINDNQSTIVACSDFRALELQGEAVIGVTLHEVRTAVIRAMSDGYSYVSMHSTLTASVDDKMQTDSELHMDELKSFILSVQSHHTSPFDALQKALNEEESG